MEKEEIIVKIKKAFEKEQYPGDKFIVYDNTGYDLECVDISMAFKGKQWNNLHDNFLFEERDSIYFFSKEGFKYYLPAYMIVAVKEFDKMDTLPDIVIHKLTLPTEIDTVLMANGIKQYRIDKQFSSIDFNKFLQNSLKVKNKEIHNFILYMNEFNSIQKTAIKLFLEYMISYSEELIYDPYIALERYWFQF